MTRLISELLLLSGVLLFVSRASATDLIWTDFATGQILRGPADASESARVLFDASDYPGSPGSVTPGGTAVDTDFVYWTDILTKQLLRGNIDGSGSASLLFDTADYPGAPAEILPEGLDVSGEAVVWADRGTGQILRGTTNGSGPVTVLYDITDYPGSPSSIFPLDVSIDGEFVYWSDSFTLQILRGKLDGTEPINLLFQAGSAPRGLEIENGIAYWASGNGRIVSAQADGTGLINGLYDISDYPDAPASVLPFGLAVDGESIFWTDLADVNLNNKLLGGTSDGLGTVTTRFEIANYPGSPSITVPSHIAIVEDSADFDTDNDIDGADFLAWQRGFGTMGGATKAQGDANADGNIDDADLAVWQNQYGDVTSPLSASTNVPEPGSAVLMLLGVLFFYHRGHRVCGQRTSVFSVLNCLFPRNC